MKKPRNTPGWWLGAALCLALLMATVAGLIGTVRVLDTSPVVAVTSPPAPTVREVLISKPAVPRVYPYTPLPAVSLANAPLSWEYRAAPVPEAIPAYDDSIAAVTETPPAVPRTALKPVDLLHPPSVVPATVPSPAAIPTVATPQIPPVAVPAGRRLVAIVLDDMGVDYKHSMEALDLPAPIAMSYLPYAKNLSEQTAAARRKGHILMLHVPMESMAGKVDTGPDGLFTHLPPAEMQRRMQRHLSSFSGYVGVNNHMGSKFTASRDSMNVVMPLVRAKGVFFLDSRTTIATVVEEVAGAYGVPVIRRDVFLDDTDTQAAIAAQLQRLEQVAARQGHAIAIGHPRPATLAVLRPWLATLADKGITLVPVTALLPGRAQVAGRKQL
jgi:hypothetical protein